MAKYTLTEEEEQRLRDLSVEQRDEKFKTIEREINTAKVNRKAAAEAARDYIGELEAQRKFLAGL